MMLTEHDITFLSERHISESQIIEQINRYKSGFPFIHLISPAIIGNGIEKWNEKVLEMMIKAFEADKEYYHFTKFVPASGAASRMFKDLFAFFDTYKKKKYLSISFIKRMVIRFHISFKTYRILHFIKT
jgi:hypothetical protein